MIPVTLLLLLSFWSDLYLCVFFSFCWTITIHLSNRYPKFLKKILSVGIKMKKLYPFLQFRKLCVWRKHTHPKNNTKKQKHIWQNKNAVLRSQMFPIIVLNTEVILCTQIVFFCVAPSKDLTLSLTKLLTIIENTFRSFSWEYAVIKAFCEIRYKIMNSLYKLVIVIIIHLFNKYA